jgi:hypothetical protein
MTAGGGNIVSRLIAAMMMTAISGAAAVMTRVVAAMMITAAGTVTSVSRLMAAGGDMMPSVAFVMAA